MLDLARCLFNLHLTLEHFKRPIMSFKLLAFASSHYLAIGIRSIVTTPEQTAADTIAARPRSCRRHRQRGKAIEAANIQVKIYFARFTISLNINFLDGRPLILIEIDRVRCLHSLIGRTICEPRCSGQSSRSHRNNSGNNADDFNADNPLL